MRWARVWKQAAKHHRNRSLLLELDLGAANVGRAASVEALLRARAQMQEQAATIERLEFALMHAKASIPSPESEQAGIYRALRRMRERGRFE